MQDNDPKHTCRWTNTFSEEHNINWWLTTPETPDLNPIKDLWHKLKFFLESKVKPRNKQELIDDIKKFWERRIVGEMHKIYRSRSVQGNPVVVEAESAAANY